MASDGKFYFQLFIIVLLLISSVNCMIENLYCGETSCYDVLDVTRDSSKGEISKAYRELARKWHPDRHKSQKEKDAAAIMFRKIATAYETLKDEDSRKDYDYMLDHPEEYYSHYYRYYRHQVAPKIDVRIVIAVTITVISVVQYISALNNYKTAISCLIQVPKYRIQARDIAEKEGLLDASKKKKDRTKTKEELKEEEENILKMVLQNKMDIRGGYQKPSVYDILWLQLVLLPLYVVQYVAWYARWVWRYQLQSHEYDDIDKHYLIRRHMKLSQGQYDAVEEDDKEDFMTRELWKKSNFTEWKAVKEEEMKAKLAGNNKHKMYRRYMKKGGAGQMSFGPD